MAGGPSCVLYVCLVLLLTSGHTHGWLFSRSNSGSSRSYNHDIRTQSGLTSLYNQPVVRAEHWERPLEGMSSMVGPLRHSGVVVTTPNGQRWLVHKGDDYGRSSQTVVVDGAHMSGNWRRVDGHSVRNSRVADFVGAGGSTYDLLTDNCHSGRCRMMSLP